MTAPRDASPSGPPVESLPDGADGPDTGADGSNARMGAKHLRGSLLLLVGRVASMVFTIATQVIIVRALSKGDYGIFALALAISSASRTLLSLGIGKSLSRFLSIYEEQGDYGRLFGSMVITVGTIAGTSLTLIAALLLGQDLLVGSIVEDPRAITVLLVLIFLAPMEALDQVFVSLFAVFTKPRSIFFRKYLLTPGLRLLVVLALALLGGDALFLAIGYVGAQVLGLVLYVVLMIAALRERQILAHFRLREMRWPFRSVFSFSVPLLSTELVYLSMNTGSVLLLSAYWGAAEVAEYRAVFPAAGLNKIIYSTFLTLYLPMAARLFIRDDWPELRAAYWRTSGFLAVLSFPVFAMTGPFAEATTVTLFGERYASSAVVLSLLAVGYYLNSALGFNAVTLQACGRVRYLVGVNVTCAALNLALSLLLTLRYGAVGVAVANATTLAAQNALTQLGLRRTLDTAFVQRRHVGLYLSLVAAAGLLWLAQVVWAPGIVASMLLTLVVSGALLLVHRRLLELGTTFPELRRVPGLRRLVG